MCASKSVSSTIIHNRASRYQRTSFHPGSSRETITRQESCRANFSSTQFHVVFITLFGPFMFYIYIHIYIYIYIYICAIFYSESTDVHSARVRWKCRFDVKRFDAAFIKVCFYVSTCCSDNAIDEHRLVKSCMRIVHFIAAFYIMLTSIWLWHENVENLINFHVNYTRVAHVYKYYEKEEDIKEVA